MWNCELCSISKSYTDLNSSLPQKMSFKSVGTCQMIAKGYVLSVMTKEVERRERGMKEKDGRRREEEREEN